MIVLYKKKNTHTCIPHIFDHKTQDQKDLGNHATSALLVNTIRKMRIFGRYSMDDSSGKE